MPTTIYRLRDQHRGMLHDHTWSEFPTAEQLAPILAELGERDLVANAAAANEHTEAQMAAGPVSHARGWCFIVATTLYGPGEVPPAPAAAASPPMSGSGIGRVG